MIRLARILALLAALGVALPAHADQVLPPGRLTTGSDILFGAIKLGKRQSGKTIFTPDRLEIQDSGSTGDVSGMSVKPTGGVVQRSLAAILGDAVDAAAYGVVADYNFVTKTGTDNTTALAAAINAAQSSASQGVGKRLILPPGPILTGPQTLSGQIAVEGRNSWSTTLVLRAGAATPLVTIQSAGSYAFPVAGYPNGGITLSKLRLTSVDQKLGYATTPNAHGISWATGTWRVQVSLEDVTIFGMPGDGLSSISAFGSLNANRVYFINNGGRGTRSVSNNDWEFSNCQWSINEQDNIYLSGDTSFLFYNPNIYSSRKNGIYLYNSEIKIVGGSIDRNSQSGLVVSGVGQSGSHHRITSSETFFGINGSERESGYSDIDVLNGSAGEVRLSQARFWRTQPTDSTAPAAYSVRFNGAASTKVFCRDCQFFSGGPTAAGVTNVPTQFITQGIEGTDVNIQRGPFSVAGNASVTGTLTQIQSGQYTGFTLNNASGPIAKLSGQSATNDFGALLLARADNSVPGVYLTHPSNGEPSYINNDLTLGNGSVHAAPVGRTFRGANGLGSNIAGATLGISGGRGTGTGTGGDIVMRTAPAGSTGSTLNVEAEQATALGGGGFRARMLTRATTPTTTDFPAGMCGFVKNTGDGTLKAYCNDSGTLKATSALN